MNNIKKLFENFPIDSDLLLITSEINRRYFSGMKSSAGVLAVFKDKSYLLIDFRYYEKACTIVSDCEVILLEDLKKQLTELCLKHSAKKVLIESDCMTVSELNLYIKKFPDLEFDSSDKFSRLIEKIRTVKKADEIEKIHSAQKIAEKAFENVLNFISVGKSEKEIAFELDTYMLKNGAEGISFDTIALSGLNTSLPHGVPSERTVKNGEFVLMDFGAVYDGYHSDMTRTVCVGHPNDEMKKIYGIVKEAQEKALSVLKAGIKSCFLDKSARDVIEKSGYGKFFGHSLGHGVGMEIHEHPNASPKSETLLEENMIITIEPGIYLPEKFGVRIEDFTVIKSNGYFNLTGITNEMIVI